MLKSVICPQCQTQYWTVGQTKKCKWCGVDIMAEKVRRVYAVHLERKESDRISRVCASPFCNKKFESYNGKQHCSDKCSAASKKYRTRMRAKMAKYWENVNA